MRIRLASICLTLCTALAAAQEAAPATLTQWDVEGMYAQAKATLEDRSIVNVEGVPVLLEACSREGHGPATRLLIDVYEGKFKDLAAKPEQAARVARLLAELRVTDKTPEDVKDVHVESMYRLATYLERGFGCEKNELEAYQWMKKASDAGWPQARVELARYLIFGKGCEENAERAWKLLHKQAKAAPSTPNIFFYMGYICQKGVGNRPDLKKASMLYHMGAQMNDPRCLNNLGSMYERGIAVPRHAGVALKMYRKAAALGNKEASANMQRLAYKEGRKAGKKKKNPPLVRIHNAAKHIIAALPFTERTRSRIRAWLIGPETGTPSHS